MREKSGKGGESGEESEGREKYWESGGGKGRRGGRKGGVRKGGVIGEWEEGLMVDCGEGDREDGNRSISGD